MSLSDCRRVPGTLSIATPSTDDYCLVRPNRSFALKVLVITVVHGVARHNAMCVLKGGSSPLLAITRRQTQRCERNMFRGAMQAYSVTADLFVDDIVVPSPMPTSWTVTDINATVRGLSFSATWQLRTNVTAHVVLVQPLSSSPRLWTSGVSVWLFPGGCTPSAWAAATASGGRYLAASLSPPAAALYYPCSGDLCPSGSYLTSGCSMGQDRVCSNYCLSPPCTALPVVAVAPAVTQNISGTVQDVVNPVVCGSAVAMDVSYLVPAAFHSDVVFVTNSSVLPQLLSWTSGWYTLTNGTVIVAQLPLTSLTPTSLMAASLDVGSSPMTLHVHVDGWVQCPTPPLMASSIGVTVVMTDVFAQVLVVAPTVQVTPVALALTATTTSVAPVRVLQMDLCVSLALLQCSIASLV